MPDTQRAYEQDGVNIRQEDEISAFAADICRSTYKNSPFARIIDLSKGNFRGPRGWRLNVEEFPFLAGCISSVAPDNLGTKVVVIDAVHSYFNAARDVVAMTSGDITRWGGLPLIFSNVLGVHSVGDKGGPVQEAVQQLLLGLGAVANEQQFVVLNGETAEYANIITFEDPHARLRFLWNGFMIGVYHPEKRILGDTLQEGQVIIALKENGFRCNGLSSVRKALAMKFGTKWWANPKAQKSIQAAATPSVLYDKLLVDAHGWTAQDSHSPRHTIGGPIVPMHLIVHLTGGSFRTKLGEDILFPMGFSADLDNLYSPSPIMRRCAQWRRMDDEEAYEVWNGGQGALVVVDENSVRTFINMAKEYGILAKACGRIVKRATPSVTITSKFGSRRIIQYQ